MLPTNHAFLMVARRAERQPDDVLAATFVDFGAVLTILASPDHHIVYGRRGTGKTHLLTVLKQQRRDSKEVAVQLDMRTIGSANGIYGDTNIPLAQRGTRLLIDVLAEIHQQIFEAAITSDLVDLGAAGPALDAFFEAHSQVKVVGETTVETSGSAEANASTEAKLNAGASPTGLNFSGELKAVEGYKGIASAKRVVKGEERCRVNFGSVAGAMQKVVDVLPGKRLWLLIDEWSEVPLDLQPYLADLLRRALLPVKGLVTKVAAIEHRSKFLLVDPGIGRVGLELGADIAAAVNLDDFMVFENDEEKAVGFFRKLVLAHVNRALRDAGHDEIKSEADMLSAGFTQANAFTEVVRACEGVPRDALNILHHAAQKALDETISVGHVRTAAQQWFQASKDTAISARNDAKSLLVWLIDKVIKERQTKAFLLESGQRDELVDFLYDERVLHVLRKSVSAKDAPGVRFNVYVIDYGCYVDLINTARAPKGVLDLGTGFEEFTTEVPKTDFRSIRRCVLDLGDFHSSLQPGSPRTSS